MEEIGLFLLAVMLILLGGLLGFAIGEDGFAKDCKNIQLHVYSGVIYECKPKP